MKEQSHGSAPHRAGQCLTVSSVSIQIEELLITKIILVLKAFKAQNYIFYFYFID